jgi:hypothetical protein
VVEAQHPTEAFGSVSDAHCRSATVSGLDQSVVDALMIPLPVVVSGVLLRISIEKGQFLRRQEPIDRIGEVPPDLRHPASLELGVIPAISTRRVANSIRKNTECDETTWPPDLDREEVSSGEHVQVGL